MHGPWVLCDGGYLGWAFMQYPAHCPDTETESRFSRMLESMREDTECTFGILKASFRILKYGFRLASEVDIDCSFLLYPSQHAVTLGWPGLVGGRY